MIPEWLNQLNAFAWIASNVTIIYIGVILAIFVVVYYALFDPSATTGGKFIFRFALSLLGVMILTFISIFINPVRARAWFEYPGDILWWRPVSRLVIYGFVAYSTTLLTSFLWIRKFYPHKLRTAKDLDLVQPRNLD